MFRSILKTVVQKSGTSGISSQLLVLHDAVHCAATVFTVEQLFAELMKDCMKSKLQRFSNWASLLPNSEASES